LYLLRVGYGGTMGELSNIDEDGFGSAAFHSFPDMLAFDPYSGDYGSGFWGFAANTATYIVNDPSLGWLSFGGDLEKRGTQISVIPRDAFRNRVYLAPIGLWITLDAGSVRQIVFDTKTGLVHLILGPAAVTTPEARMRIEQPGKIAGVRTYVPVESLQMERGAWMVPLHSGPAEVMLHVKQTNPNG
jgi:hypothetical protein